MGARAGAVAHRPRARQGADPGVARRVRPRLGHVGADARRRRRVAGYRRAPAGIDRSGSGVLLGMDRRPVALYLACAGELVLAVGAAAHRHTDAWWVTMAALGLTVAALGIAGCAHLGLRNWGPRIAL